MRSSRKHLPEKTARSERDDPVECPPVALDPATVTAELAAAVQTDLHSVFLESQVAKAKAKLLEALPDEDPQIIESRALADGLREYNLSFRREMLGRLTALQARRISVIVIVIAFLLSNRPASLNWKFLFVSPAVLLSRVSRPQVFLGRPAGLLTRC